MVEFLLQRGDDFGVVVPYIVDTVAGQKVQKPPSVAGKDLRSQAMAVTYIDSSVEFMGEFRFRELAKCVIEREFGDAKSSEAIGFSHGDFGFVVQTLDYAAGELLFSLEVIEN